MSGTRKTNLAHMVVALVLGAGIAFSTDATAEEFVQYEIVDGSSIPKSLTGVPGDAKNGRKVAINRKLGNCLACHELPIPDQPFHGQVGPDLKDVANNLSEGELRLRIVDSKVMNPEAFMPAFYRNDGFTRVMKKFQGKTILSAQQVEDVVAYLLTLKGDS